MKRGPQWCRRRSRQAKDVDGAEKEEDKIEVKPTQDLSAGDLVLVLTGECSLCSSLPSVYFELLINRLPCMQVDLCTKVTRYFLW